MCDKVFTALKVNAQVKARKRKEIDQASGYITTSSSEILHEASFTHRTKLNMSSLQNFVNSSNPTLPNDLATVAAAASQNNQYMNLDIQLPAENHQRYFGSNVMPVEQCQSKLMAQEPFIE